MKKMKVGDRMFFNCSYPAFKSESFKLKLKLQQGGLAEQLDSISILQLKEVFKTLMFLGIIAMGTTIWSLWQERNRKNFEEEACYV